MSEMIGMDITIGGKIRGDIIEDIIETVRDDISEFTGPDTPEQFRRDVQSGSVSWSGSSNYGECDDLKAILMEHDISYRHHCDAKYEYDASIEFWKPDMEDPLRSESDQDQRIMINAGEIRPVLDVLKAYVKDGKTALPLFIGDKKLERVDGGPALLEECIKNPRLTVKKLVDYLDEHVVAEPELPPIEIIEVN